MQRRTGTGQSRFTLMLRRIGKSIAFQLVEKKIPLPLDGFGKIEELVRLKSFLDSLDINCFLDVGANTGQTATALRGIGYRGHIISFEPVKSTFTKLQDSFKGDPLWKGLNIALGAQTAVTTINVLPESTVMSSLLAPKHRPIEMQTETIQIRRLDEIFDTVVDTIPTPRVLLKMDTQGYDLEVLRGAQGCLPHILALQSEISARTIYAGQPRYLDALREYEQAGFELFALSVVSRAPSGAIGDMNCIMLRKPGTKLS